MPAPAPCARTKEARAGEGSDQRAETRWLASTVRVKGSTAWILLHRVAERTRAMDANHKADFKKLGELIKDVQIAMLTTFDLEGRLHTRPVETLQYEPGGNLWFFTDYHSPKVNELQHDMRVSVGYAHPSKNIYVAVTGTACALRDSKKARELWTPSQRAWYPDGVEDERLAVLRVSIERAEYWITPGRVSYVVAALKALVTGRPASVGEDRKLP
jgi:general stress protein 26